MNYRIAGIAEGPLGELAFLRDFPNTSQLVAMENARAYVQAKADADLTITHINGFRWDDVKGSYLCQSCEEPTGTVQTMCDGCWSGEVVA